MKTNEFNLTEDLRIQLQKLGIKIPYHLNKGSGYFDLIIPENVDRELAKKILPDDCFQVLFVNERPKPKVTYSTNPLANDKVVVLKK